ncbi:MAG: peptidase MA family metallohydrolase [candidate division Zixibacteria bacterium]|nr:peptidase MA family metallohydrolase [candidate division Zixibacteria bacterium]
MKKIAIIKRICWGIIFLSTISSNANVKNIQPIHKEHFDFYFTNTAYVESANIILENTRLRLIDILKDSLDYKPKVYLIEKIKDFNILTRGLLPDWGAAAAFPQRGLIAVKSPDKFNINKSLEELLIHEYAHLALAKKCGFNVPPKWLNEGFSMYVSMEWGWSNNLSMSRAAVFGQLLSLYEIEKMNRFSAGKADIAYSESYLAVKYLLDEYGVNSFNMLLRYISQGEKLDDVLSNSIGGNYKEFNEEFLQHINKRYNIVSLFMNTSFFWIGLAIVVIIGSIIRYKKRRKYFKKWEEEEKFHSTDFDYGDPDNPEQIDDDEPWRS